MRLQQLERDAQLDVPRDLARNVKALEADPKYRLAWEWFTEDADRLSYVPGQQDPTEFMIWREGRRFKPVMARRIVAEPITDDPEPEPPADTMVKKQERRARRKTTGSD